MSNPGTTTTFSEVEKLKALPGESSTPEVVIKSKKDKPAKNKKTVKSKTPRTKTVLSLGRQVLRVLMWLLILAVGAGILWGAGNLLFLLGKIGYTITKSEPSQEQNLYENFRIERNSETLQKEASERTGEMLNTMRETKIPVTPENLTTALLSENQDGGAYQILTQNPFDPQSSEREGVVYLQSNLLDKPQYVVINIEGISDDPVPGEVLISPLAPPAADK